LENSRTVQRATRSLRSYARNPITLSHTSAVNCELLPEQSIILRIQSALEELDLAEWARARAEFLRSLLLQHGALLLRGFSRVSVASFQSFMESVGGELIEYSYRSTPRTQVSGRVYSSTEYPPAQHIPLHNEMSYTRNWPLKIAFCCIQPAENGGETPIADSARVFARIAPEIRSKFSQKGVMYVRNYGSGLDLSWQNVFQTEERSAVEEYCRKSEIQFEWRSANQLRTRQICQAIVVHPISGTTVWFNQAHLFHVSSLDPALRESLLAEYSEEELPRNAYYGDGSPIGDEALENIRAAYNEETVTFEWQAGDILLADNMLIAHGRRPFTGPRKVVVAMSEPFGERAKLSTQNASAR
jgi:alpha-ketoglutarate-dependent taurine dioxygenase